MQQQQKARRYVPFWLMAATTVVFVLAGLQLLAGFQQQTEASPAGGRSLPARKLADDSPPDKRALRTTHTCVDARGGLPEQRVCVFHDLVLYNGRVLYVTDDANDTVPPIKISWLKKFEGDDFFQHTVVNQSQLEFNWDTAQVEDIPQAGLIHQQHYSNFYHMFSEVAPSVHFVLCKFLGDCTYSADSKTRLFFIQEKRPDIPVYIMLDSIADTFSCISPQPVWHKDDPQMQNKVYVLKKAVVGVSNEVRAFHNWEQDFQRQYREPPKAPMVAWRRRMADCFGFNFTQAVAPTNTLRILFINRHYEEGRMILNQAKLAHLIEKMPEVKEFQGLEIDLQYLNGDDTLRHQAALFWNASLLIWPHGATMAMTTFLPRGAQAIEVIPWVEDDKARHPEWVQAIRDTFSLSIDLYAIQNKERRRVMFNQDALAEYPQYRDAAPEHKIALLEQGVCPPGVDGFTCPFWWNHWKVSVNLDWALLEPTLKAALSKLIELRKAGGQMPASTSVAAEGAGSVLEEGAGADAEPAGGQHNRSRTLAESPAQHAQQRGAAAAAGLEPAAAALLAAEGAKSEAGAPLSSLSCLHDDGKAEHRLCVASNLVAYMGKLYYLTEDPASVSLPEIQISWEDWEHVKDLREDKYFAPQVVRPSELPFTWDLAQAETIDRAWLPHIVDSGNFYHILSEVLPTFFANWCKFVGVCHYQDRQGFEVLFIQPDPKRRYGLAKPLEQAWQCFSQKPPRKLIDVGSKPVLVKHGVVGIGPYMRAYEQQGFRKSWEDPPAGLMPKWLQFLSACTGTGFAAAQAPKDVLRITFVNRPWSAGRSFLNLHEVVVWLTREWLPARKLPRPFEVETATVHEWQDLSEQIAVFQRTSILVYPHGATMTHAIFLPKGSVALEVIPWPSVTEPHGWLQSIKRQYELEGVQLGLLVNKYRANLVLNWQALSWDPVWKTLTAEEKVALQEDGTCPKAHEPKCFFDWLHWRSELVLDKEQLGEKLTEALGMLGLDGTASTA